MNLRRVVLALTVLMTVLRLVLAAKLGLGDDEAYYWEWSRRLALSYFDHPAMVAWLIHAGTFIFGDTPLGVRFFGLVANGVSGYFIWRLAKDLFSEQAAWYSLFLYVFAPIFTVGGILMVPDAPMAAAWMGYTWLLWQLWKAPAASWRMWLTAAFVLGFGLVSKYTTLLLAVSTIALFASDFGSRRKLLKNKFAEDFVLKFVVAMLVAAACCAPILIWNFQLDWPTLKFHLHDRQTGGGGANFNRWIQFWVSQLIILGPGLFAVCMVALVAAFRRRQEMRWRFIAFAAAPPLAIFTLQALFAEFKPHWPAPAYPLLFIGASQLYIEGFGLKSERTRAIVSKSVAAVVLIFFVLINVIFHVGAVVPIAHKLSTVFAPDVAWDPKFDPTNDLYGWDELAREVKKLEAERLASGAPPYFLSSSRYQHTAQLAFATGEQVWRVTPTRDQYTFWQTQEAAAKLGGHDSLFVVDNRFDRDPRTDHRFSSCDELQPVRIERDGDLARTFRVWKCKNFDGHIAAE